MRTIPLRAKAIPRVAMNDGTRSLTVSRPLINPSPQHTNSARTMPGNTGIEALFQYVTKKGDTMYIWPTDRSISPRIRTGTSASAKMAKGAMNWDSTRALSDVKKFGDSIVKKIANPTATRMLTNSLRCWLISRRRPDAGLRRLTSRGARVFELISSAPDFTDFEWVD